MTILEVYIDYKSPYAFVANNLTYALTQDFDVQLDWYPLTLNIKSYLGSAKKSKSGVITENRRSSKQWQAVKYAYMDARRYVSLQGLTLRGTEKIWDSSYAAIGLLWAKQQNESILKVYSEQVFKQFWRRQLNIEDCDVIETVLIQAGADTNGFQQYLRTAGRIEHDQLQTFILEKGYFGVPTYVLENEVYFGREHLSQIKWHLDGHKGAMPDISYDCQ